MALLNQSVQVYGQIPKFLETLRQGQAPEKFTRQFLKDIDFKSSNHMQFIPLLKGLGFLTSDGSPTERYKAFLDSTRWKKVLAEAIRDAYSDIFVLKAQPTSSDRDMIAGKFKSTYNLSDTTAERAARTFLALLDLSDKDTLYSKKTIQGTDAIVALPEPEKSPQEKDKSNNQNQKINPSLHYNIQIHLPATKDIEVYNAIFKSLKEHVIE